MFYLHATDYLNKHKIGSVSKTNLLLLASLLYMRAIFGRFVRVFTVVNHKGIIQIQQKKLIVLLFLLREHFLTQISQLVDLAVKDLLLVSFRFQLYWNFSSLVFNNRLFLKGQTDELEPIPSISFLFPSALWVEREVYDMFGIYFSNHTDLKRLLTDYGFDGYPLRKDFPLSGFREIHYATTERRIITTSLSLAQEYRLQSVI